MEPECPICNDGLLENADLVGTPCGHVFHKLCLDAWLRRSMSCPQCRYKLHRNGTRPLYIHFTSDNANKMRDLQTRLEDLQNMMLLKETKMTASESEIKNLTTKLKSEKNNNRKCLSQVANLKMEKFKLSRKLELKTTEAERLSEELKEKDTKIGHLEKCMVAHRQKIEIQRDNRNTLINELTAKKTEIEELKREVTGLRAELEETKRKKEVELQEARATKEEPMPFIEDESEKQKNDVAVSRKAKALKKKRVPVTKFDSNNRENEVVASSKGKTVKKGSPASTENVAGRKKGAQGKQTNVRSASRNPLSTIDSNTDVQEEKQKCRYFLRPR